MIAPTLLLIGAALAPSGAAPEVLVTPQRLAELYRSERTLVVVHATFQRESYDREHLPGARYLVPSALWTSPGMELPTPAAVDSVLEGLGISNGSRVVLYGDPAAVSRAYLALDYVGMGERASVLDGGLGAWKAAGRPVTAEVPQVARGSFTPKVNPDVVVSADWIRSRLDGGDLVLLDARSRAEHEGTTDYEGLPRYGRIPGALLLPWDSSFARPAEMNAGAGAALKPAAELAAWFRAAGVPPGGEVVTYCTIGMRASHLYLVAKSLGYKVRIYDGSMRDWAPRPELPMVRTGPTVRQSMLLSPAQLARWLPRADQLGLVVLEVGRDRASYDTAHVAGARFVPFGAFARSVAGVPTELPPVAALDSLVESLGVSDSSRVVLYGDPLAAARLFFTLDYLGLGDRIYWLDGGLDAWRAEGQPVTRDVAAAAPGRFTPRVRAELVVSADWVHSALDDPGVSLLDARTAPEYDGTQRSEGEDRPGHIPGAANIDWQGLLAHGKLKPIGELQATFAAAGVKGDSKVVTYCRVGTRASFLYFVSRLLGHDTALYDGSMAEWSGRADLPVVQGSTRR